MYITNPKLPIVFGHKNDILNSVSDKKDIVNADYLKLFNGYITVNLKTDKDIDECEKLMEMIETYCGYELYNINAIISIRGLT